MGRIEDVVHVIGDVCRHAPCLRKLVVSTVIYLLRIPRSAIVFERLTSAVCSIYLANEVRARTHTVPLKAGPRLLLPHTKCSTPIADAKLQKPASWYEFYREGALRRKNPFFVPSKVADAERCKFDSWLYCLDNSPLPRTPPVHLRSKRETAEILQPIPKS
jgi:hypothetical protein